MFALLRVRACILKCSLLYYYIISHAAAVAEGRGDLQNLKIIPRFTIVYVVGDTLNIVTKVDLHKGKGGGVSKCTTHITYSFKGPVYTQP